MGLVQDVPTVQELFDRILEQATEARERLDGIVPTKAAAG
jgi:hypothetical protein